MEIILYALAILALYFIIIYNHLIKLQNRVKNGWAQIDVQLKRRHNLIPNLVETVKGYMQYEKETLEKVVKARQVATGAQTVEEHMKSENILTQSLKNLFAVVENYPDIKANQSAQALFEELTTTENRLSFARQHYNDEVVRYNTFRQIFPQNFLANLFKFKKANFFEIEDKERERPRLKF